MKFLQEAGLTFDDVLLVPQKNNIESRQDVSFKTRLTKKIEIDIPLVSANMDTVTESPMMMAMYRAGGIGILHRFMSLNKTRKEVENFRGYLSSSALICASLGVNGEAYDRLTLLLELQVDAICIDVAHGHSKQVIDMIEHIHDTCDVQIIAGNVATAEATKDLIRAGAHAIKVGIGPGSMCSTRLVTGNGVPQLSAIIECYEVAKDYDVPIIADGGIRYSGDIVKAIAAGAESVMIGSLFAGTEQTPGEIIENKGKKYKKYQGMASKDAMIGWKGPGYHAAPEGESVLVPYRGSVEEIIKVLISYFRSGMTYQGARTIQNLRERATFRKVSANCLIENTPHGKY